MLASALTEPIDAVITWVDGADPKHTEKLYTYLQSIGGTRPRSANPMRFHNAGELEYCVTSLLKFAPWFRHIYIVTDEQIPPIIETLRGTRFETAVSVVDHRSIFSGYAHHLPTFNSSSILPALWRIPGLANNFVFFNDDFALIKPVTANDFFRHGKVVLRGKWSKFTEAGLRKRFKRWLYSLKPGYNPNQQRPGYIARQELAAKSVGYNEKYFQLPHNPHAWRVSTFKRYFEDHPDKFEFSIGFKLRSDKQFIIESLSAHLELLNNSAIIDNQLKELQIKPADQSFGRIKRKFAKADKDPSYAFVCVQSIEKASPQKQDLVFSWLNHRIGRLSDFVKINS